MKRIVFLLLICASLGLQAQETIPFCVRGEQTLCFDLYRPAQPRPDKACVVYLFGGGFMEGSRDALESKKACKALADRGFVVAAIDYRLGLQGVKFDTIRLLQLYKHFEHAICIAVEDCCAACAYLYEHAGELNIDRDKIILTGSSAGAVTVLQTDYCRCNSLLPAAELPVRFVPAAIVSYAGAIFCDNRDLRYRKPPSPTFFLHGTKDRIVNYKRMRSSPDMSMFGTKKLAQYYKEHHFNYWVMRVEGLGHEVSCYLPITVNEFCAFVDAVLSGRVMRYDFSVTATDMQPTFWSAMGIFDLYIR